MPGTAQDRLAKFRELKRTGAEEIDRRGRVKLRSLKDMNSIEADLIREAENEENPGRVRVRRIVVSPRSGF
ncbi:hypothetical protein [Hansschlegelia zhihuaiae]|uniref:Uncharacterized protein n=1 Tax=Hansschlegelia zhihuaiae TaxID=405005 RepID=A0A4Q0M4W4_9HYPH|nr:hypothetical protein [Hansschlegelia zhihuaiae]RXF67696.1 hypothetical protein EK403_21065 [Hansschlegelia zhihuaiae]